MTYFLVFGLVFLVGLMFVREKKHLDDVKELEARIRRLSESQPPHPPSPQIILPDGKDTGFKIG